MKKAAFVILVSFLIAVQITSLAETSLFSWGAGDQGQLGIQEYGPQYIPIESQINGISEISCGDSHILALKNDGTVWAWGNNSSGQLGDGTNNDSNIPVQISGLTNAAAIAGGGLHSLALKTDGTVWAWGYNALGQLGDGTNNYSNVPVQVLNLTNVIAISGGYYHSIALKNDGTVWSWGYNNSGQLGDGTNNSSNIPVQVLNLTNVMAISGGFLHSISLKSDGTVWAWGYNGDGQLGNGTNNDSNIPIQVLNLTNVMAIAGSIYHSMALKTDGTVWAWGSNWQGQLGDGTNNNSNIPVQVLNLTNVIAISGGFLHSIAIKSDGSVWAWGSNDSGQLGNGTSNNSNIPVQVSGLTNVAAIAGGWSFSFALKADGTVWAWGANWYGQLGNGYTSLSNVPLLIPNITNLYAISGGSSHSLALKTDGTVWAWGYNGNGQLGNGTNNSSNIPFQIAGLTNVIAISSGGYHSIALKSDGTVWAWGSNDNGQLGDGTNTASNIPVPILNLSNMIAITGCQYHSMALKDDGTVWAWGDNYYGQLGDGTNNSSNIPVQVLSLTNVIAISGGSNHSMALKNDGTVWAWGNNSSGQLGDGTHNNSNYPVQATNLSEIVAIAGGDSHSLALKADGTVWAWGANWSGQLGHGGSSDSLVPVQSLTPTGITAIAAGSGHSLALTQEGFVWAWGYNYYGQLGNGSYYSRYVPVQSNGVSRIISISAGGVHSLAMRDDNFRPPLFASLLSFTDECIGAGVGGGDGYLDAGEEAVLSVTLFNNGYCDYTNISAELIPTTTGVYALDNSASFPDIPIGQSGQSLPNDYRIKVPASIPCGSTVEFYLIIHASEGDWTDVIWLDIGHTGNVSTALLSESFDGTTFPPSGWQKADVIGTSGDWVRGTGTVHPAGGGTHSGAGLALFNSYTAISGNSTRLYTTTAQTIPSSAISATLTFWMYHDILSTKLDKINVQVSTDGTNWATPNSNVFYRYDGSTGWKEHTLDLSGYIGQSIRIGFLGTSTFRSNDCHIDDVMLEYQAGVCIMDSCAPICQTPSQPVITNIADIDTCVQNGIIITFNEGYPATRHDFYVDGNLSFNGVSSPVSFNPNNTATHDYMIRAIFDEESCFADSMVYYFSDGQCPPPGELAPGYSESDALIIDGNNIASWPLYAGASGYRIYRGTWSDLPNLPNSSMDSCIRYSGTGTSINLLSDDPQSVEGNLFWYLATAHNASGEGDPGHSRIVNPSGMCPTLYGSGWIGVNALMPQAMYWSAVCSFNGKIYVFGGNSNDAETNTTYIYDPANDTWTQGADMPTPRYLCTAAEVDGKIYVMGGRQLVASLNPVNVNECYDPATNTWTTRAVMPNAIRGHAACAANGKIYVLGGNTGAYTDTVSIFDPAANSWANGTKLPVKVGYGGAVYSSSANSIFYVGGVKSSTDSASNFIGKVYAYSFASNSWDAGTAMPDKTAYFGLATNADGSEVYIVSGSMWSADDDATVSYPFTQVFLTASKTFDDNVLYQPSPWNRENSNAAFANGTLYLVGGEGNAMIDSCDPSTGEFYEPNFPINDGSSYAYISGGTSGAINGKFYVVEGGYYVPLAGAVYAYDPGSNTWAKKNGVDPTPRMYVSGGQWNDKVVVYGGMVEDGSVVATATVYDPLADTFTAYANANPNLSLFETSVVLNDKLYLMGGRPDPSDANTQTKKVNILDLNSGAWSTGADMPVAIEQGAAAAYNNKIYFFGGIDNVDPDYINEKVYIYDPAANSWTTGPSQNIYKQAYGAVAFPYSNYILVDSGYNLWYNDILGGLSGGMLGNIQVFDPATSTFKTEIQRPFGKMRHCSVVIGDRYYSTAGEDPDWPVTRLDIYDLEESF